ANLDGFRLSLSQPRGEQHPNVSVDIEERLSDEIVGLIAEGFPDLVSSLPPSMRAHETFRKDPVRAGGGTQPSAHQTRRGFPSRMFWTTTSWGNIPQSASRPAMPGAMSRS